MRARKNVSERSGPYVSPAAALNGCAPDRHLPVAAGPHPGASIDDLEDLPEGERPVVGRANWVVSLGETVRKAPAGPLPARLAPWQAAQRSKNSCSP
jgi:hypothetical protein